MFFFILILFHKYKVSQFRDFQRSHGRNNGATGGNGKDEKVVPSVSLYSRNYKIMRNILPIDSAKNRMNQVCYVNY